MGADGGSSISATKRTVRPDAVIPGFRRPLCPDRETSVCIHLTLFAHICPEPDAPRQLTPKQYRTRALGLYERGAEQLFFWDTNQRTYLYPSSTEISRLGHREDLARWVASGSPRVERPGKKLTTLGDWVMGYVTPG